MLAAYPPTRKNSPSICRNQLAGASASIVRNGLVIGEMALFSGDLYFTTVGPDAAGDYCSSGNGKV